MITDYYYSAVNCVLDQADIWKKCYEEFHLDI